MSQEEIENTYRIVRFYADPGIEREIICEGLSLEEAQDHCSDPETSSKTATSSEAMARTSARGSWFDGFTEE